MVRERNYLYGDERPLPYWVQLVRIDDSPTGPLRNARPMLLHLDLRGGEFSRTSSNRLADTFDWLTRAYRLHVDAMVDYALMITPLPHREDEEITGQHTPYIPDDWPTLRERSFLWLPVAFDEHEKRYAWQR